MTHATHPHRSAAPVDTAPPALLDAKGWYNGFTPAQRNASIAPQRRAKERGILATPTVCSVTGHSAVHDQNRAPLITHLETYAPDKVLDWYPCSRRVHNALHARFHRPRVWYAIVYANYRHGAFFTLLTQNPYSRLIRFDDLYPRGLPSADHLWPEVADELGVHRELFKPDTSSLWGLWLPSAGLRRIS